MSLLNDALRKKNAEHIRSGSSLSLSGGAGVRKNHRKRWLATALVVTAGIAAAIFLIAWYEVAPSPTMVRRHGPTIPDEQAMENSQSVANAPADGPIAAAADTVKTPEQTSQQEDRTVVALNEPAADKPAAQGTATVLPTTETPSSERPVKNKAIRTMPTPKAKTPKPSVRLLSPIVKPAAAPSKPVIAARGTSLAEALFEKARQYHRRHQLPQAIALYRQAIEADPDHFDARFNLTSAYLDNQDYETAYPLAAALARQKPQDPQVLLNLAVAHIGCGRPEEAVRLLDRIAEFPKAPLYEVYFHKGIALRRMNQPARAQEWYEKALHIRGDDPRLLFNMAVARDQLGQYKAAVQAYRDYLENSPAMAAQERRQIEERIRVLQIAMPPTPVKEANPR